MGWDVWKGRRETAARDTAIANAIASDIEANKARIQNNLRIVNAELAILAQDKSVIEPLILMNVGFWDIAKINPPQELFTSGKLAKLSALIAATETVNEQVRSRESYKLHNGAMDNFSRRVQIYDEMLVRSTTRMSEMIAAYEASDAQQTVPADGLASRGRG